MRGAGVCLFLALLACGPHVPTRSARPPAPLTGMLTLPFTELAGMVVLTATIGDDPTPRRFVFDADRDASVITPAVADRLGLRPRRVQYGGSFYGTYRQWSPLVDLPRVRVGDLVLAGGQVQVADLERLSEELCVAIDGVLVVGRPFAYEIDHAASVLRVAESVSQLPVRADGIELPRYIRFDGKALGVEVLRAFTVREDGNRTWLYRNGRPLPRGLVGFGFDWHVDDGEAKIGDISHGTAALGLWHGAKIVALDGQVIASLSAEELCRLRRDWRDGRDSVRVAVEVEREGEEAGVLEVEVRRRPL